MHKFECQQDLAHCGQIGSCGARCPQFNPPPPEAVAALDLRPQDVVWVKYLRDGKPVTEIVRVTAVHDTAVEVVGFGGAAPEVIQVSRVLAASRAASPFLEGSDYE